MPERFDLSAAQFHLRRPVYQYHQYQGSTNNCGPTSLAMAANALLGAARFQGATVAEEMNAPAFEVRPFPHWVVRRVRNWATFPWGIVQYLRQHTLPAHWALFGTGETLRRNLLADQITILMLGDPWHWAAGAYAGWAHAKVLFGYTPGRGFLFVDPAYESGANIADPWQQQGLTWQDETEFFRQWRALGNIHIEVG